MACILGYGVPKSERPYLALMVILLLTSSSQLYAIQEHEPFASRGRVVPSRLYTMNLSSLSDADAVLAQSIQGLVGRKMPKVWLKSNSGVYPTILNDLKAEGTVETAVTSVWTLYRTFKTEISGMIVYDLGTDSINVATSLCGPWNCVAVETSQLATAQAEGLTLVYDARGKTESATWTSYGSLFADGIAVEQDEAAPKHLRDFAIQRNAFTFYTADNTFRQTIATSLGPGALVYGWGPDEYNWWKYLSKGNAGGIAANWCTNLSALSKLTIGGCKQKPRTAPAPAQDGQRIVAFVLTDGDNVQWYCTGMTTDPLWYGNPLRGTFCMTWEMPAILGDVGQRVLQSVYDDAHTGTYKDCFVPYTLGTTFPKYNTDMTHFAARTAHYMTLTDSKVVTIFNDNSDVLSKSSTLLDRAEVMGVIYKDWSPYNAHSGSVYWRNGKPCVSYKYVLWEGQGGSQTPSGVASAVAGMPNHPLADQGSYALINVHAWSWSSIGGPLNAVKQCIDLLPANTRVVTAEDLIYLMRASFGTPVTY